MIHRPLCSCSQAAGTDAAVVDCGALGGTIVDVEFATVGPVPSVGGHIVFCHSVACSSTSNILFVCLCVGLGCFNLQGTCGAFATSCGVDFRQQAAEQCVGKSRCEFVPNSLAAQLKVSASDMCVREEYAEATAIAIQATCSVERSIVDVAIEVPYRVKFMLALMFVRVHTNVVFVLQAPVGIHNRTIKFPAPEALDRDVSEGSHTVVYSVVDGTQTEVFNTKNSDRCVDLLRRCSH